MARRERTRHLIELGGLVQKAGLVVLTDDDRAMLYGAFLDVAARIRSADGAQALALFKRRGARAFATEAEQAKAAPPDKPGPVAATDGADGGRATYDRAYPRTGGPASVLTRTGRSAAIDEPG